VTATLEIVPSVLDRIRRTLVGLKMPRALEVLDQTVRQLERGEASALEVIDTLFAEELTLRENRRVKMALRMAKLDRQDARRLPLLVPALTRQEPNSGARAARLYQWQRGDPLPRSTRNRKEPPRHRARRRGGKGRPRRLLLKPCRHCRHSRQGRAGRVITRADSIPLSAISPDRRRDWVPAGHSRRRQFVLPARQRPL
jgi:hypothetical protein